MTEKGVHDIGMVVRVGEQGPLLVTNGMNPDKGHMINCLGIDANKAWYSVDVRKELLIIQENEPSYTLRTL